jgi:hypothetical protein
VAAAVADAGALLSINHPVLDLGDACIGCACIGCAWENPVPPADQLAAVEIATGGWAQSGQLFDEAAIAFWDALVDGIRAGLTVVKLQGPDDPMVVLGADPAPEGDTARGLKALFTAEVTGGEGERVRFVVDGVPRNAAEVDADPFTATLYMASADGGRVRPEVLVDGLRRAAGPPGLDAVCNDRREWAPGTGGGAVGEAGSTRLFGRRPPCSRTPTGPAAGLTERSVRCEDVGMLGSSFLYATIRFPIPV